MKMHKQLPAGLGHTIWNLIWNKQLGKLEYSLRHIVLILTGNVLNTWIGDDGLMYIVADTLEKNKEIEL